LTEHGDKISEGDREKVEAASKELKEALDSPEKSVIEEKVQALTQVSMVLGEALYKASQAGAQEDTSSEIQDETSKADAEAVDVEFEEVDEDNDKKKEE
jgi:molecular chaperone DnaK